MHGVKRFEDSDILELFFSIAAAITLEITGDMILLISGKSL